MNEQTSREKGCTLKAMQLLRKELHKVAAKSRQTITKTTPQNPPLQVCDMELNDQLVTGRFPLLGLRV